MKKLIVANFKMNPGTERQAGSIARRIDFENIVIAPPFPFLGVVRENTNKASLGAQDVFWESKGAYTGEVSPSQLKNFGVKYVIIGHSERRKHLEENEGVINKKIKAALGVGLKVILCVGEPEEKGTSLDDAKRYVKKQLENGLSDIESSVSGRCSLIVAYEPVWAIGTGKNNTPERTEVMAIFIKEKAEKLLGKTVKVLYGGSVNSDNAILYLDGKNIDGVLVGGSSLKPNEMIKIARLVDDLG